MSDEDVIPPAALLVRDFVNTYEPQTGEETLTSTDALRDWFVQRHLMPPQARLRRRDLDLARTIREGLRSALLGDTAAEGLNRALAEVPVRLTYAPGGWRLEAAGPTATDRALAGLLDAVRQCTEDGTWARLKVCARDTCHWAFFDASRNQVRRWCSMAGCGTHIKNKRAYAARTRRFKDDGGGTV